LRLVGARRLSVEALTSLPAIRYGGERTLEALAVVLEHGTDPAACAEAGLKLCERWAYSEAEFPRDSDALERIWNVLELAANNAEDGAHVWGLLLARVARTNPQRTAELACQVADSGEYFLSNQATSVLSTLLSSEDALTILNVAGVTLLAQESWRAGLSKTGPLLLLISDDLLFEWLDKHGLSAARALAFHMPEPFLDEDGQPAVSSRSDRFLRAYGHDAEVIENFCNPPIRSGLYFGDIAARHEEEADRARPFLTHEHLAVRTWAEREAARAVGGARRWREVEEERDDS
jgi:hypothetical protein